MHEKKERNVEKKKRQRDREAPREGGCVQTGLNTEPHDVWV